MPNVTQYENKIMSYTSKENELVKTVRCGKMAVGYAHIYYTDYDDVDPKYNRKLEKTIQLFFIEPIILGVG